MAETITVTGKRPEGGPSFNQPPATPPTGPRLLEWSVMDVTCFVQHKPTEACAALQDTETVTRLGESRFRVAHGLSEIPQEVHLMRLDNEVVNYPAGGYPTGGGDRLVPGLATIDGGVDVRYRDTTAFSLVCLNTARPIADKSYSYFTVGFPIAVYPIIVSGSTIGAIGDFVAPQYVGNLRSATSQHWWGNWATSDAALSIRLDEGPLCPPTEQGGPSGSTYLFGQPIPTRAVRLRQAAVGSNGRPMLVNCFVGIEDATTVTVRVISRLWDGPTKRGIFTSPGPEAHPAP